MQKFTNFSEHALMRIAERTQLKPKDISEIIENGSFVNIGRVPGFNKEHLLYYSTSEDDFFFIVRDYFTGTVLTVMPVSYRLRAPRELTDSDFEQARKVANSKKVPIAKSIVEQPDAIRKILISAHFISAEDRKFKTKVIAKVPAKKYGYDIEKAIRSNEVKDLVLNAVKELNLDMFGPVEFSAKSGNHVHPTLVNFNF